MYARSVRRADPGATERYEQRRGALMIVIGVFVFMVLFAMYKSYASVEKDRVEWNWTPRPLPLQELGKVSWMFLHNYAASIPEIPNPEQQNDISQFIHLLAKTFPCESCGKHLQSLLAEHPPQTTSRQELMHYICTIHNHVNKRLSKPFVDCLDFVNNWSFEDCDVCTP